MQLTFIDAITRHKIIVKRKYTEFHNSTVKVIEIIDSLLPGYLYIELRYLLTECSDDDNYTTMP